MNASYPLPIQLAGLGVLTDEEFFHFCAANNSLKIERQRDGSIHIMSPESPYSGRVNASIQRFLYNWSETNPTGIAFGADTGFTLPDGAVFSPDACWVSHERFSSVPANELQGFPHLCPDFVIEVASPSDSVKSLKKKMVRWRENGVRLGWLIVPVKRTAYVYQESGAIEEVKGFDKALKGGEILPGFELDLSQIPL